MRQVMTIILCIPFIFIGLSCTETEDDDGDNSDFEVWQDDFEDAEIDESWIAGGFWGEPSPNWSVEDGVLKGSWPYWNGQFLFLEEYDWSDYTIEVKVRIDKVWQSPDLAGAGIHFRSSGKGVDQSDKIVPMYGFGLHTGSAKFLVLLGDDSWHYAGIAPEEHNIGQWYRLKLVVKGDDFLGYVDDRPICRLQHSEFKGKFVGLGIGSNIDASFDDFMITNEVDDAAFSEFDMSP